LRYKIEKFLLSKRVKMPKPSAAGSRWSQEEEKTLMKEINSGIDIEQIAEKHKRTQYAIKMKLQSMAYTLYKQETPIEQIVKLTGLSEEEIALGIEYCEKKNPTSGDILKQILKKLTIIEEKIDKLTTANSDIEVVD
jgi:hypothetical protein